LIYLFILLFSLRYLGKSKHFDFILLAFVLSMVVLVHSGTFTIFFVGWDGLGLTSLWLILWYKNLKGNISGAHVFLTIRLGDAFLLLSLLVWFSNAGPFLFFNLSLARLLLVLRASTKSAQFPFTTWLPLAIAAPTPVSALVHRRTLVTAGIFIILRVENCSFFTPSGLIFLGLITANLGAIKSLLESDVKKRIAYSTLSHCGVIIYGLGLGYVNLVFIHLILHAFFKSILFILAGWSLVSQNSNQDTRLLGINFKLIWNILGFIIIGLPFLGIWYRKHRITGGWSSLFRSVILIILTVLSTCYIGRLSIFGSYSRSNNKVIIFSNTPIPLLIQSTFMVILSFIIITPVHLIFYELMILPISLAVIIYLYKNKISYVWNVFIIEYVKFYLKPNFEYIPQIRFNNLSSLKSDNLSPYAFIRS